VQKNLILAVILSLLAGSSAWASCPSNPADCPATTASTLTTPNLQATGIVHMSGLSSGTQTSCLGLNASANVVTAACGSGGGGGGLTVGSSPIVGGTPTRILYDNAGVLGEYALDGRTIVATSNTLSTASPTRTAASPTVTAADMGGSLIISSGGVTIPVISAGLFNAKQTLFLVNYGGSAASVTNNSGQAINAGGGCGLTIPTGGSWQLQANGTSLDCLQTVSSATGGGSTTIANNTAVLGTSAIASGVCASAIVSAGPGIATTDVIWWGFNGDPTAVTGYAPTVNGMLTIIVYPTTNNANFKVCNNTAASVTPGAITLNWRVIR